MIKVVAKFLIKTNRIEEMKAVCSDLIDETRKENGNISYELYQDVNNPEIFTFIEEWESQEALDQHMQTDHFKKAEVHFENFAAKDPEVNIYSLVK